MTTVGDDEDLRWRRLLPYRTVEVVDANDQPLPPHQLGQIRGLLDNNFTGYLNDSDASASFVKREYFYPGDLGVLDGQGRIALHGRVTMNGRSSAAAPRSSPTARSPQRRAGLACRGTSFAIARSLDLARPDGARLPRCD